MLSFLEQGKQNWQYRMADLHEIQQLDIPNLNLRPGNPTLS